jgi:hypothetical protein
MSMVAKHLRRFSFLALFGIGSCEAATITVSAGLANQGITPSGFFSGGTQTGFTWAVGTWDGGTQTFTSFGSLADSGEVNGSVTAIGPASFNGQEIFLFIGGGPTIAESGDRWVVLRHTPAVFFPADVSGATGATFTATTPAAVTIVGNTGNWIFVQRADGYHLIAPEPSSLLMGLVGLSGLLRRRRV